ncbi:MAG: hypothetical protein HYZ75_06920 [Elusimicrobia bacterium]|nr:hypothetical protein [Elusimicrobiota bacterium]
MKSVELKVPKAVYSEAALTIAAQVFAARAEISVDETKKDWDLTLESSEKDLDALAGDFLVELLNHEYRILVSELNKGASSLLVTQALLAARG